jgi:hypothetical protein
MYAVSGVCIFRLSIPLARNQCDVGGKVARAGVFAADTLGL